MIDTHCHVYDPEFNMDLNEEINASKKAGVNKLCLIGTTANDSRMAAQRAIEHESCYAVIGVHPHEAKNHPNAAQDLAEIYDNFGDKVIAVGEIGLDYWYLNSKKELQQAVLKDQMTFAAVNKLPLSFHIRGSRENPHDAFVDAWQIIDAAGENQGGIVHSFTGDTELMNQCLDRGFYLGFNGILTFTKEDKQISMLKAAPLDRIVLETDAPFLAPAGKRGEQNTPANIPLIAEQLAAIRGDNLDDFINATTANAQKVYKA